MILRSVRKHFALAAMLVLCICFAAGISYATEAEPEVVQKNALIGVSVSLRPYPSTQVPDTYLSTAEEMNDQYTFKADAEEGIEILEMRPFYDRTDSAGNTSCEMPSVIVIANDLSADGKKVSATMTNNWTGETYSVEYVINLKGTFLDPQIKVISGKIGPYTRRADGDFDLEVEEGSEISVTISAVDMNNEALLLTGHDWEFYEPSTAKLYPEGALQKSSNTARLTVQSDMDGYLIEYDAEHFEYNIYPLIQVHLKVVPPSKPTLSLNPQASPAAKNGVITVLEGETVTIQTNAACSDSSVPLTYEWVLNTLDENGNPVAGKSEKLSETSSVYSFTATMNHDGKQIAGSVTAGAEVDSTTDTAFTYVLDVQSKYPQWEGFDASSNGKHEFIRESSKPDMLYAERGASVTVKANYTYAGKETLTLTWEFEPDATGIRKTLASNGNTCTFVLEESGKLWFAAKTSDGNGLNDFLVEVKTYSVSVEDQTEDQKKNQTVTVVVPDETVEEAIQNTQGNVVELPLEEAPVENDMTITTAKASDEAFARLAEAKMGVSVPLTSAEVVISSEVVNQIASKAKSGTEIKIQVEQNAPEDALNKAQLEAFADRTVATVVTANIFNGEKPTDKIAFNGPVTIRVPFTLPAGESGHDYTVIHVADNGTVNEIDKKDRYYTDGYYVFTVYHFSDFVITKSLEAQQPAAVPQTGDHAAPALWILGMLAAMAGCVMITFKRRQNG